MQKHLSVITFCVILLLGLGRTVSGQTTWELKSDSMNLAILVLDYQTYVFEQGHFSVHPLCDSCDTDSLPFYTRYHPPGDFGDITFYYDHTGDTIFHGTIIWMGGGRMYYPDSFDSGTSFGIDRTPAPAPASTQHFWFGMSAFPQVKADSVWENIKYLKVLKNFAAWPYRVGIYLYPPSVGAFDPSVAKWIVFVYRGNDWSAGGIRPQAYRSDPVSVQSNPSPFTNNVTFHFLIRSEVRMEIVNCQGQPVQCLYGKNRITWNGMDFSGQVVPDGIYWARVFTGRGAFIRQIIKVER